MGHLWFLGAHSTLYSLMCLFKCMPWSLGVGLKDPDVLSRPRHFLLRWRNRR